MWSEGLERERSLSNRCELLTGRRTSRTRVAGRNRVTQSDAAGGRSRKVREDMDKSRCLIPITEVQPEDPASFSPAD
ncbi:hypothetical protein AOLI_G00013710 [Acnodon oligacanthus]